MEQSSLAVIPWAALYSRLDATELTSTNEIPQPVVPRTPVPVMFPPSSRSKLSRVSARPSPVRPTQPAWERWLETPVIQLSHIMVLVVSGTMFGVGLSALLLEFLNL